MAEDSSAYLGTEPCLEVQGPQPTPLAAVGENAVAEEEMEIAQPPRSRPYGDDDGQEEVGARILVPEEDVVLRELEVLEAPDAGLSSAGGSGGEEPAAAGTSFGGDLPVVQSCGRRRWGGDDLRAVEGDGFDFSSGDGARHRAGVRVCLKAVNHRRHPSHSLGILSIESHFQ